MNQADTDMQARVLVLLAREGRPMAAAAIIHQVGTSLAFLAKMQQVGVLEFADHGRRYALPNRIAPSTAPPRRQSRPAWQAQKDSAASAARRRLGRRFPATGADLRAAIARSQVRVTRLPPGAARDWVPSWWGGIAPAPAKQ